MYFAKVEPRKQMKAVLCVLPNALLVTLQKTPKIQGLPALAYRLQVRNSRSNLQGLGLRNHYPLKREIYNYNIKFLW